MARAATAGTALTTRLLPPADFKGTPTQWRVLTETIWPAAKSAEAVQLAIGYCAARHLDPFKRPVHIVPVYNSMLKREVETVWPGISELLTTAARSKAFAGVDPPEWGPDDTRTFKGTERINDRDVPASFTITFPVWCSVRVWRQVQGERRAFSQPVFWMEAYGRRGFRSELPTAMWEKRPRGQLHKCALAAALRLGFPEDLGSEYAAEEMEGREVDHGGVVIEGETARDRQADAAYGSRQPPGDATGPLDEPNGQRWLTNLRGLLAAATAEDEVVQIAGHRSVHAALAADADTPTAIREEINAALATALARFRPAADEQPSQEQPTWEDDPMQQLLDEVQQMDAITLANIGTSAPWRARVHEAAQIPQDEDRVREAIEQRQRELRRASNE